MFPYLFPLASSSLPPSLSHPSRWSQSTELISPGILNRPWDFYEEKISEWVGGGRGGGVVLSTQLSLIQENNQGPAVWSGAVVSPARPCLGPPPARIPETARKQEFVKTVFSPWSKICIFLFFYFFLVFIYFWLRRVLVVAGGLLSSCGMWA